MTNYSSLSYNNITNCGDAVTPKNIPVAGPNNIPIAKSIGVGRRYIDGKAIDALAVSKYRKNGKPITFTDLLSNGLAGNKEEAKSTLKWHLSKGNLFTLGSFKPQQYYPSSIRADVLEAKSQKNIPVVGTYPTNFSDHNSVCGHAVSCMGRGAKAPLPPQQPSQLAAKSLQEVLNSLQWFPLYLHKFQLELHVSPWNFDVDLVTDCYQLGGYCIKHEHIGKTVIKYLIHDNGTIMVTIACSSQPFRLETEDDEIDLFTVLAQVRDRLLYILKDERDRFTPKLLSWNLNEIDINKDIPITDRMQLSYNHLQLVDAGRVFRLYVKSMGSVAVCRAEESVTLNNTPIWLALRSLRPTK